MIYVEEGITRQGLPVVSFEYLQNPVVPALLFISRCEGTLLVRSDVSPGKEIQGSGLTLINWSLNSREALSQALLGFLFLGPFGADVVGW